MKQYRVTARLPWDSLEIIEVFQADGIPDLLRVVQEFFRMHFDECEYKIVCIRHCNRKVVIAVEDIYLN
jgi:hypothetical protein